MKLLLGLILAVLCLGQEYRLLKPNRGVGYTFVFAPDAHLPWQPTDWGAISDWVVANQEAQNIQAVFASGDYSNDGTLSDLQDAWSSSGKGWTAIDALGIPWASAIGNHDYASDSPSGRNSANFDAQIGYTRLNNKAWWVGYYDDGANSKATYAIRYTVNSTKFLVIAMELFPRSGAVAWALNVMDTYSDHWTIILTHGYQKTDGTRVADGDTWGPDTYSLPAGDNSGSDLWTNLVKLRSNMRMVLNGHYIAGGVAQAAHNEATGDGGNKVHEIYANYQDEDYRAVVRLRVFSGHVYVTDYDPVADASGLVITPYDFPFDPVPPDVTAPAISDISSGAPGSETATITWNTDQPSNTQVEYGETEAYGSSTVLDAAYVSAHSTGLSGLTPETLYHYRVKSRDAAGNLATSADQTLTTAVASVGPDITEIAATPTGYRATITWTTDEAADSQVEYGETDSYGSSTTLDETLTTSHVVYVTGLNDATLYHYKVKSRNGGGTLTESADQTVTTWAMMANQARYVAAGQTDTLSYGYAARFRQLGDMSLGLWVKLGASTEADDKIVYYGQSSATEDGNIPWGLYTEGTSGAWDIVYEHEYGAGSKETCSFDTNIADDTWTYIGISRDVTANTVKLWTGDGATVSLVSTCNYTNDPTGGESGGSALTLFALNGYTLNYLDGAGLSSLAMHSRSLTEAEHASEMAGDPPQDGMQIWAPLGIATPEPDISPFAATGTSGAAAYPTAGPSSEVKSATITALAARQVANSATGSVSFGYAAGALRLLGDAAVGFWLKPGSTSSVQGVVFMYAAAGETQAANATIFCWLDGASNSWDLECGHEYNSGTNEVHTFLTNIPNDTWRYIGISRDATAKTYSVWIGDGSTLTLVETWTYTNAPNGGDSASAYLALLAAAAGSQLDTAAISDFVYYSRKLSEAEHTSQMVGSTPGTNLLVHAKITGASPEPDSSGNGYDGTVTNTVVVAGPR